MNRSISYLLSAVAFACGLSIQAAQAQNIDLAKEIEATTRDCVAGLAIIETALTAPAARGYSAKKTRNGQEFRLGRAGAFLSPRVTIELNRSTFLSRSTFENFKSRQAQGLVPVVEDTMRQLGYRPAIRELSGNRIQPVWQNGSVQIQFSGARSGRKDEFSFSFRRQDVCRTAVTFEQSLKRSKVCG